MALALPEAHEDDHWGDAAFRVGKRIFAVLYAPDRRVVLKLSLDHQEGLLEAAPEIYSVRRFRHQGWTHVCLKTVPKPHFRHHLEAAWRQVAPKRAIKSYEETRSS